MATVCLCFPLLGGAHQPESFPQLLDSYRQRAAADTAVAIMRGFSGFADEERPIASFLLANDLAELGLVELATGKLRALLDFPELAPAAFLALARLQSAPGDAEELLREAARAPWERLAADDFGEAAFLVARASFSTGRYPQARSWLAQVPRQSAAFPFSRYLLAQTEYALERYGKAIDAADALFSGADSHRWLQERTAILVGDMLSEIGLYPQAIGVLGWPAPDGPFHARAERDARVARSLVEVEAGGSGQDDAATATIDEAFAGRERTLEALAASPERIAANAADLERTWPARALERERRRAAWAAAAKASRGFDWRKPLEVLWYSFPPVILARVLRRPSPEPAGEKTTVAPEARFFFTPRGDVAKLLTAIALASEPAPMNGCAARAAQRLRLRAATSLAGTAPALQSQELGEIAAGCGAGDSPDLLPALRQQLASALASEVSHLRREARNQQTLVDEAVADARLRREAAIAAAKGADR